MTHDEIIRMARDAGLYLPYWEDDEDPNKDSPRWVTVGPLPPLLERFAALVAAAEREACAQIADEWATHEQKQYGNGGPGAAIRARGEK